MKSIIHEGTLWCHTRRNEDKNYPTTFNCQQEKLPVPIRCKHLTINSYPSSLFFSSPPSASSDLEKTGDALKKNF